MVSRITSPSNPQIKALVRLRERAAERRRTGTFLIESRRELARALVAGYEVLETFVCPALLGDTSGLDGSIEVGESVIRKVAYRQHPEGIIAVVRARYVGSNDLPEIHPSLYVICSGVEKPGNIGAILRSADFAGVGGVMIDSSTFDLYNPNCIRASTGAVFHTPVVCTDRDTILKDMRRRAVQIIAATPDTADSFLDGDLRGSVAFVVGAEDKGLDRFWLDESDARVCVPRSGSVDSLNVSVTAALLVFEAIRQRGGGR